MNRRGFLKSALLAGVGFSILPGAKLYTRKWKPNPEFNFDCAYYHEGFVICMFNHTFIDGKPVYDQSILEMSGGEWVERFRTKIEMPGKLVCPPDTNMSILNGPWMDFTSNNLVGSDPGFKYVVR
jgi:hypothetical protein